MKTFNYLLAGLGIFIITIFSVQGQENKLGAWLWYIEQTGFSTHEALADSLAGLGVKRVYVKVADGQVDTQTWPEQTDTSVVNAYTDAGLEVWAWSYNYPGNDSAQAQALYLAAQTGYQGYVVDVEDEFDSRPAKAQALFEAFNKTSGRALSDSLIQDSLPLYCTTWGNPKTHSFPVAAIDTLVDAFMPQTYVEKWGQSYINNLSYWIEVGNEEYRELGANSRLHHIVSTETGDITAADVNKFISVSGPQTSIWRVPGGGVSQDIWYTWQDIHWNGYIEDIPYYNQYANTISPEASCQNTVMAMILSWYGAEVTPDELSEEWGISYAQSVDGWEDMFNTMAERKQLEIRDFGTTSGTIDELQQELEHGRPVVVHAYFTSSGHTVVVNGYDRDYYYVHDPAGQWNGEVCGGGYEGTADSSGYYVAYERSAFEEVITSSSCTTQDGVVWMHTFAIPTGFAQPTKAPLVKVSPNPVYRKLKLTLSDNEVLPVKASIYSVDGTKSLTNYRITDKVTEISLNELAKGIYIISLKGKDFQVNKKIIKLQ